MQPMRTCDSCGWQWFHLRDPELEGGAAVTVNEDGAIDAYTGGLFECVRCGEHLDAVPIKPHLTIVGGNGEVLRPQF